MQLPYFALRKKKSHKMDSRQYADGTPLRDSRELKFLNDVTAPSATQGKKFCLYKGQISLLVVGFDEWRYDTILLVDAIFDRSISLQGYEPLQDPLMKGRSFVEHNTHCGPRTYFLEVAQVWLQHVEKEWERSVGEIRSIVTAKYVSLVPVLS